MWQEEPTDRSSWILATQGNTIYWIRTHYLWEQDHSAKEDETRDVPVHTQRYIHQYIHQGKERCLLRARNTVFWPKMTYDIQQLIKVYYLPGVQQVSTAHRNYPGAIPISMAHIGNRFLLLEKDGLSDSCRCIFKVHFGEEITQFHLCSHVHRTIYDCHRVGSTSYNQELQ